MSGVAQLGNVCVWVEIKVLRIKYELVCVYGILFDDIPFVQNKDLLKCNVNLNGGTINLMYYQMCDQFTASVLSRLSLTFKSLLFVSDKFSFQFTPLAFFSFFMNVILTFAELFIELLYTYDCQVTQTVGLLI